MALRVLALGTGVCADVQFTRTPREPPGFFCEADGHSVLFDCSEGIRHRLQAADIDTAAVTHVAVSHGHPDHAALPQFIQAKYCRHLFGAPDPRSAQLRVYLPDALARAFPHLWSWHQPENEGCFWDGFTPDIVPMTDGFDEQIAPGLRLRAMAVYHGHGRHPAMGFRLETPHGTVAYTGDSGFCDPLIRLAENAALLIADCSTPVGREYVGGYGHMGPRQCGEVARRAGVETLWLTHYFDVDAPEALLAEVRAARFVGTAVVAQDGDAWTRA